MKIEKGVVSNTEIAINNYYSIYLKPKNKPGHNYIRASVAIYAGHKKRLPVFSFAYNYVSVINFVVLIR
jgi:hypothetical protein